MGQWGAVSLICGASGLILSEKSGFEGAMPMVDSDGPEKRLRSTLGNSTLAKQLKHKVTVRLWPIRLWPKWNF